MLFHEDIIIKSVYTRLLVGQQVKKGSLNTWNRKLTATGTWTGSGSHFRYFFIFAAFWVMWWALCGSVLCLTDLSMPEPTFQRMLCYLVWLKQNTKTISLLAVYTQRWSHFHKGTVQYTYYYYYYCGFFFHFWSRLRILWEVKSCVLEMWVPREGGGVCIGTCEYDHNAEFVQYWKARLSFSPWISK